MTSGELDTIPPIYDATILREHRTVCVLRSRWGYEGVFTDHYLANNYRERLLRLGAYRTSKDPQLTIEDVPLNPIL